MSLIGNIAWLVLGGLLTAVMYIVGGLFFCVTIIGIPFGVQLMKIGVYALWPFGRDMAFSENEPGCLSTIGNVIWILLGWWEIAIVHGICGLLFCATIVGIPLGMKHFTIAKTSLFPFGQSNVSKR